MKNKITVLDAGHGGKDPGGISADGTLFEKDVALDVTLKINQILNYWGYKTLLTRDKDEFLSLTKRANIANEINADVFVSIHCNAAANPQANGIETFHYPESKTGNKLANYIQTQLIDIVRRRNRGVKQAKFTVLHKTIMPAALVEIGFVTNEEKAELMKNDYFKFLKAMAIAKGIENFYKGK